MPECLFFFSPIEVRPLELTTGSKANSLERHFCPHSSVAPKLFVSSYLEPDQTKNLLTVCCWYGALPWSFEGLVFLTAAVAWDKLQCARKLHVSWPWQSRPSCIKVQQVDSQDAVQSRMRHCWKRAPGVIAVAHILSSQANDVLGRLLHGSKIFCPFYPEPVNFTWYAVVC